MSWPWIVLIAWPFASVVTGLLVGRWLAVCGRYDEAE